ncbi:hypothetical protein GGI43DRAFT_388789 [Trichoderma evansii]
MRPFTLAFSALLAATATAQKAAFFTKENYCGKQLDVPVDKCLNIVDPSIPIPPYLSFKVEEGLNCGLYSAQNCSFSDHVVNVDSPGIWNLTAADWGGERENVVSVQCAYIGKLD